MPKLVRYSEITDFESFDAGTTQLLKTCRFDGFDWFFKQPPALIIDAKAKTLRVLNEAICGALVLFLSERTRDSFITPIHLLVVDDLGSPVGVLSQKIAYVPFMDRGTGKAGIETVLVRETGLAEISTVRFCIEDPDGNGNSGYGAGTTLSSIDYGLANYSHLFAQGALTEVEKKRLPDELGLGVFDITVDKLLSFIVQPFDDTEFLVHHAFPGFERYLAGFCDTKKEIVEGFFSKAYNMLHVVSKELTAEGFNNRIFTILGLDGLNECDRVLCQAIIGVLVDRAIRLRGTLRTLLGYSPDNFVRLVVDSASDRRFSPLMLSASPIYRRVSATEPVNTAIRERAETEEGFSTTRAGGITKANGGGPDGYTAVLFPKRTLRVGSFDENFDPPSPQRLPTS